MLEVWELRDRCGQRISDQILNLSGETSDHLIPFADLSHEGLNVPLVIKTALVADALDEAKCIYMVEQLDDGQMATQEVFDAAEVWIRRILGLTKAAP